MNACLQACELVESRIPGKQFGTAIAHYLARGYVISRPDMFVTFRPVNADATLEQMEDLSHEFPEPNAWYVDMAVGKLKDIIVLMPYFLPTICFGKRWIPRLHKHSTVRLMRKVLGQNGLAR